LLSWCRTPAPPLTFNLPASSFPPLPLFPFLLLCTLQAYYSHDKKSPALDQPSLAPSLPPFLALVREAEEEARAQLDKNGAEERERGRAGGRG
jgi:hypothetical protein